MLLIVALAQYMVIGLLWSNKIFYYFMQLHKVIERNKNALKEEIGYEKQIN